MERVDGSIEGGDGEFTPVGGGGRVKARSRWHDARHWFAMDAPYERGASSSVSLVVPTCRGRALRRQLGRQSCVDSRRDEVERYQ